MLIQFELTTNSKVLNFNFEIFMILFITILYQFVRMGHYAFLFDLIN